MLCPRSSAAATRALRASLLTVKKAEAEELRRLLEAARARRAELEAELESARAEVASQAAALRPLAEPVEALDAPVEEWAARPVAQAMEA